MRLFIIILITMYLAGCSSKTTHSKYESENLEALTAELAFDCIITSDRTTYQIGEAPNITFRITNKTSKDVVLVGSLDGSTSDRRFPKCRFEIIDAFGNPVTRQILGCGIMNPLETKDFVTVHACDTFDPFRNGFSLPYQLYSFPVTIPGEYTLRFSYTTSDRIQDYVGSEGMIGLKPEIKRLFERVPKLDLKSNELKVTFIAKSK